MPNLFADIPATLPEELVTPLFEQSGFRLERIVSRGHASPPGFWYDQREGEWVAVLRGAARLEIEGKGVFAMKPGDHVFLPARCRHRVTWTDPDQDTVWIALFAPAPDNADR